MESLIKQIRQPPQLRGGLRNYKLVPINVVVHRKNKAPYFSTRWKKVSVVEKTGSSIIIIPTENYGGDLGLIYDAWKRYISSFDEQKEYIFLPLIALQEILFLGYEGIIAAKENRVIGIVSLEVDENDEAKLSVISASPYDIEQGDEDEIEEALQAGIKEYATTKDYRLVGLEQIVNKAWDIDRYIKIFKDKTLLPGPPPGPPPRRGLQWKPTTHRWIKPGTKEEWEKPTTGQKLTAGGVRIPPGLTDVWINPDTGGKLQVIGYDKQGGRQRIYSAKHFEKTDAQKFKRMKAFLKDYPKLVSRIEKDMAKGKEEAEILFIISQTGIRVGAEDDQHTKDTKTYGARTLLNEHVNVRGNDVFFDFTGKKGVKIQLEIKNNSKLASLIGRKKKENKDRLFSIDYDTIRDYLKNISQGKFIPKDFRTAIGTSMAQEEINKIKIPETKREFQRARKAVAEFVSKRLGNSPGMALKKYISPMVFTEWETALVQKGIAV